VRDQEGARDRRNGENDHARGEEDPEKSLSERLIRYSGYSRSWLTSGFFDQSEYPVYTSSYLSCFERPDLQLLLLIWVAIKVTVLDSRCARKLSIDVFFCEAIEI